MPMYFFDVTDGLNGGDDSEGSDLTNDDAAIAEAFRTASELCYRADGERDRSISVSVRTGEGKEFYRADLSLRGYRT